MSVRLTVVHSYSKKMLESGDNQIKKKTETQDAADAEEIQESAEAALAATSQGI